MASLPSSDAATAPKRGELSVRLAKVDEFGDIVSLLSDAFIHDPTMNYFGNVRKLVEPGTREKENLELFISWLLRSCYGIGGRITVVVDHNSKDPASSPGSATPMPKEKIAAAAFWLPPNVRIAPWMVIVLVRSGVMKVLGRWGFTWLFRIGFEFADKSHSAMKKGYMVRGIKESPDASWLLQYVGTDPAYQGRGCMSSLVREAYAHAPTSTFTLEANTAKSRDQYEHLGFELLSPFIVGKGKVNAAGLPSTGEHAVGVDGYAMINRTPRKQNS